VKIGMMSMTGRCPNGAAGAGPAVRGDVWVGPCGTGDGLGAGEACGVVRARAGAACANPVVNIAIPADAVSAFRIDLKKSKDIIHQ
jgi:hypothetical protein